MADAAAASPAGTFSPGVSADEPEIASSRADEGGISPMSPSDRVAGPPGSQGVRMLRAAFTMMLVLAAPAPLRAQAETDWVGKRVVPRDRDFVLRIDDEPVEPSRKAIAIYRVEQDRGRPDALARGRGQRLSGSARIAEVIPVERAVDFFTDRIRVDPRDAFSYAMRALVRQDREGIRRRTPGLRPGHPARSRECACLRCGSRRHSHSPQGIRPGDRRLHGSHPARSPIRPRSMSAAP